MDYLHQPRRPCDFCAVSHSDNVSDCATDLRRFATVQVNQGLGQTPGHSYGGIKQSGIGREFSLEGMLDSFTEIKSVNVNLAVPPPC